METNNNKIIWIVVGLLVLGAVIFIVWNSSVKYSDKSSVGSTAGYEVPNEPESVLDTSGSTPSQAVSLSYTQALVQYKDHRIQFDKTCSAFPNTVTYKDNTGLMLDNRSPNPVTVKVGTTYTIKGYGFRIITLQDVQLTAKVVLVDCGAKQNVATILIQE
jgi:hypothetical protein